MSGLLLDQISLSLPRLISKVDCGVGSLLMIEFPLSATTAGLPASLTKAWIYLCDWKISLNNSVVMDSNRSFFSEEDSIEVQQLLVGESLVDVHVSNEDDVISLRITGGKEIILTSDTSSYDEEDDMLLLYFSDCSVTSYSPANKLYSESTEVKVTGSGSHIPDCRDGTS